MPLLRSSSLVASAFCALLVRLPVANAAAPAGQIHVPAGFRIELLTDQVPNARAMTLGRFKDGRGIVYVGSMDAGVVYGLEVDGARVTAVHQIATGLSLPAGLAWRDGDLYVSAVSKILKFRAIDDHLANPPAPEVVTDRLARDTHHGAKFLAFGPDGWLYVPTGAPCNICEPDPARYANITRMRADGTGAEIVARGIRNTVGFDWNPVDHSLWFTDNGRDLLGDEIPNDELNHVSHAGENFGFPYCHQGDLPDPEFGKAHACSEFVAPEAKLGPHVASLGMRFYSGSMFPSEYRNNVFIAEHGSWNRTRKIGYRIARVELDANGHLVRQSVFAEGWLQVAANGAEKVSGRPADVLVMPDGSLLVSDDFAGAIYRISYAPS